jgi:hypothetical protein
MWSSFLSHLRLLPMDAGNKKPTFGWVHKMIPPRSSTVGVISLSANMGDSMPSSFDSSFITLAQV